MWSVVTESPSTASTRAPMTSASGFGSALQALEERRLVDVRGVVVPGEQGAGRRGHLAASARRPRRRGRTRVSNMSGVDARRDRVAHLLRRRPDVAQVHRLAVGARAERLRGQVDVDRAGQRVGDHQRRRGEVARAHLRVDAALEVAVAARAPRRPPGRSPRRPRRPASGSGPRVADAGRAAVADEVEARARRAARVRPGALEVVGDDARARREARLDPRLRLQAALDRLLGEQARAPPSPTGSRCWCSA